ncbi:MAG: hypothetical protein ACP5G5_04770 [Thermoplasmata archaeon]|jgi:ribosomal protein S17E|nr:hypothetical protein [Thermoplasmatales archaeon]PMP75554.1 MAG: hypothetical protein C0180_01030 [Aciduliprofundum sp.]HEU12851.1 hypothetical protein [Euryarchaeota archaeon]
MVSGYALRYIADFVEEKKGAFGKEEFTKKVNERNVIAPRIDAIDPDDEFSPGYFERILDASAYALKDAKLLNQLGFSYGKKFSSPGIRLLSPFESNQKIINSICSDIKKYAPSFNVTYEALSDKKFVIRISNIKSKEYSLFLSGYLEALFKKIQKKIMKVEEDSEGNKKIIIKFL